MNREVKFRAWDGKKKKMMYDYQWIDSRDPHAGGGVHRSFQYTDENGRSQVSGSASSLSHQELQYTGFEDVNGVEYYENYLVSNNLDTDNEVIRQVMFVDGCWFLVRVKGASRLPKKIILAEFCGLNMPVVGNIYEHKKLIGNEV